MKAKPKYVFDLYSHMEICIESMRYGPPVRTRNQEQIKAKRQILIAPFHPYIQQIVLHLIFRKLEKATD